MRISPLAAAFVAIALPLLASAQDESVQIQSVRADEQIILGQIMTDKRAIVLKNLGLDDAEVQAFTPIYDNYQVQRKKLFDRAADLLDLYASNYGSMTDDAARKILRDWFSLQEDEVALTRKYAKQFEKVLPPAKVVRFVQIENKLDTLLKLKAVANVPLAR